ncbi:ABC transporter substrate-binding protein [Companilactobacillus sp. HBUAS56275]|uniref:Transporter substrate-binding domain-containing protein n=1 Tax=Candidatus Companilactobacillus pullicola TaxID=2838523 RepID=A0A9D2CM18_9LACO|nr:transporter substrate-binding domain-containing protein [Candidatus Companilactobacillus pullicola]
MKSLKKISIFLVACLLMLSSFSFVGVKSVQAADTDQVQYTVGTTKNISSAIAAMGKNRNAYTNNNLNADVKAYDSTKELNSAISDGTVNAAVTDLVNYAAISKQHSNWKIAGTMPGYYGLVANKKYKSVKKLKGKTIAVDKADYSKYYLKNVLKKSKLKLSSVKLKQIDSEKDRVSALKSGDVDAAVLQDPSISEAKVNGDKVLKRDKTKTDNGNVLIVNNDYAKKNESNTNILVNVIKQEIKSINKTGGYMTANNSFSDYGVSGKAVQKLNDTSVKFKTVHKVKKSDFNKAFKYAKQQKLYKGKISYKKANMKIRQVK